MKQALFTLLLLFSCSLLLPDNLFAQSATQKAEAFQQRLKANPKVENVVMDPLRGTPNIIQLTKDSRSTKMVDDAPELFQEMLELRPSHDELKYFKATDYLNNIEIKRYQQYLDGIKVEHGRYMVTAKDSRIHTLNGEFYQLEDLNTTPTLSEADALNAAMEFVGADKYAWEAVREMDNFVLSKKIKEKLNEYYEDYLPKGELVIVDNFYTSELDMDIAYKFNIYAAEPLSRDYIYVNAKTGEIMLKDAIIKHANGGDTRYSGRRDFGTEIGPSGLFELLNTQKGGGIETLNLQGVGGLPLSIAAVYEMAESFTDNNGSWDSEYIDGHNEAIFTNEVNNDDIALDAHWGAETVYDYWLNRHGRRSYDGNDAKLFSFVHYGVNYDNAFWNGSYMTYGDGSWQRGTNPDGSFGPLTSMDVCAHEIGHAICSSTSDLVYARESGAMNEGFSDIWAACVEHFVLSTIDGNLEYDPWGIGEQIDERDNGLGPGHAPSRALRWMDDPKAAGDPDTYGGDNWTNPECGEPTLANDYCGVHSNSGVLNKWFYFLVQGSGKSFSPGFNKNGADDGINDAGGTYNFNGIGFEQAEKIAFLTETLLSPTSTFQDARNASEVAAGILYGPCSIQQLTTLDAWDAVNVTGTAPDCTPRIDFLYSSSIETEESGSGGCNASKLVTLEVYSIGNNPNATVIAMGTGANPATEGLDFDVLTPTVNFSSFPVQTITIEIYDDAYAESDEHILLSIAGYPDNTHLLTISDNDVIPQIGNGTVNVLAPETFSSTALPNDWSTITLNGEGGNNWKFNGTGTASGRAYVAYDALTTPTYNQTADAHVILRSPYLDARGKKDLHVAFNYQVGGEVDAVDGTLFDYGSFGYSTNGNDFVWLNDYVGAAGGTVPSSGTTSMNLPAHLAGKQFYLGWRWYNDALVGTAVSFSIDNPTVTGEIIPIATAANSSDAAHIDDFNEAFFYNINGEIIAKVESQGGDFGCVEVKIEESGNGQQPFEFGSRAQKVFRIESDNTVDDYEVTFYFKAAELASFGADATALSMIQVQGTDIDAATTLNSTIKGSAEVSASVINGDGDIAYTATFTADASVFGVLVEETSLPVGFLDFNGKPEAEQVVLNWETISEENNQGFEILRRAANDEEFVSIGFVNAQQYGDSNQYYEFNDANVKAGTTYYYQLKQVDYDNRYSLSDMVFVALDAKPNEVEIYPNPATDLIFIDVTDADIDPDTNVEIYSVDGQLVRSVSNPDNTNAISVDLSGLVTGMYLVKFHVNGNIVTERIIKSKN